jgi:hypothetical protein
MLKMARVHYQILRDRFGHDPGPDEPLFFDSNHRLPVIASEPEIHLQIKDAAAATRSDYISAMKHFGLG